MNLSASIQTPRGWLRFSSPSHVLETHEPDAVPRLLERVERETRARRCYAVGFVSYEAASAFGLPVATGDRGVPLLWFGLFREPVTAEQPFQEIWQTYDIGPLEPSNSRPVFECAFARIKRELSLGTTYQVNYTFRMRASFRGDAAAFFQDLAAAQRGGYSAFLTIGSHSICSASPELFFERQQEQLTARPMKGTLRRGRTLAEDREQGERLRESPKQRAENVMIVDMVRNDLGRVAETGSVSVPALFTVERYPNVWQMTSSIAARSGASLEAIFSAVHPSASVTGAPKRSTMEIIAELEGEPRGVYTGAIGYVGPDGHARFSVAIRTAVIDHGRATLEFGIGSGIVWDSDPVEEYEECLLKASILARRPERFELLETLRWTPGEGYFLLQRHLDRLRDSAEYFGFPYDEARIRAALGEAGGGGAGALRVRLLLMPDGTPRTEQRPHRADATPLRVRLASAAVDETDPFLFHKTTNRLVYERHRAPDVDEVILWNSKGEITEALTANIVASLDGARVTPPVTCGLLAGTMRAEALARGDIVEAPLTIAELRRASRIWLINSVHEWREAQLVD